MDNEHYFDELYIAADYEESIVGAIIQALKYRFVKELAGSAGKILCKALERELLKEKNPLGEMFFKAVVVPVPLTKRRQQWRGFNQVAEIARFVAQYFNLEYRECLSRRGNHKPQAKLSEAERLINLDNAFINLGQSPEYVVLIDDVITTGTTVNECAKQLKANGAKRILVCALAKG